MADIAAPAPRSGTPWKGKKAAEYKADPGRWAAPCGRPHGADRAQRKSARLTRQPGLRDDAREAFWNQLDVAYFLRHDASDIAWHTRRLITRWRLRQSSGRGT